MRTAGTLVGLTLMAWTAAAHAQEGPPPAPPPPAAGPTTPAASVSTPSEEMPSAEAPAPRLQLGLNFVPMALGKLTATATGNTTTIDGAFAWGFGLTAAYEILPNLLPGFTLGVAPQIIFKGGPKEQADADREIDLFGRIAYGYRIPKVVTIYVEALPGFSQIKPGSSSGNPSSKGFAIAAGVGAAMDLTDRFFLNLGAGYQLGYQKVKSGVDYRNDYVRVTVGGGVQF